METRSSKTLDDVPILSHEVRNRRGVMIVELRETETNLPSMHCPVLCSSSFKDVDVLFKEQSKQRNPDIYSLNCYEWWEVGAVANMLYLLGDRLLGRERMEYVKEAFDRFVKVGGLPRHIFAEERWYTNYTSKMEEVTINEDFLRHLNSSQTDKLDKSVKYFLAPIHTCPYSWKKGNALRE